MSMVILDGLHLSRIQIGDVMERMGEINHELSVRVIERLDQVTTMITKIESDVRERTIKRQEKKHCAKANRVYRSDAKDSGE